MASLRGRMEALERRLPRAAVARKPAAPFDYERFDRTFREVVGDLDAATAAEWTQILERAIAAVPTRRIA